MKFPLYDISDENWHEQRNKEHNLIFENPFIGLFIFNKKGYTEKRRKEKYVDCDGQLFTIFDCEFKRYPDSFLGYFLPLKMVKFKFKKLHETMEFTTFKDLIIKRCIEANHADFREHAIRSTSFVELLNE